jgi:hypothetical protein
MKSKVMFEIDYRAIENIPCAHCGKPKGEHFQYPLDSDIKAHWCPNRTGTGFTSMEYRRKVLEKTA